jgi:hypothetical protein
VALVVPVVPEVQLVVVRLAQMVMVQMEVLVEQVGVRTRVVSLVLMLHQLLPMRMPLICR